jgi:nascent polypeptide-associated complex subunit alpha
MKINPKQLERMARQMGMQMDTIEAEEVIIVTKEKKIVIQAPQVAKVNAMGQETYQVSGGEIKEVSKEKFSREDIEMIMAQTGADEEDAIKALDDTQDIAEAIMKLKKTDNN